MAHDATGFCPTGTLAHHAAGGPGKVDVRKLFAACRNASCGRTRRKIQPVRSLQQPGRSGQPSAGLSISVRSCLLLLASRADTSDAGNLNASQAVTPQGPAFWTIPLNEASDGRNAVNRMGIPIPVPVGGENLQKFRLFHGFLPFASLGRRGYVSARNCDPARPTQVCRHGRFRLGCP
jgi:hypothetical protein